MAKFVKFTNAGAPYEGHPLVINVDKITTVIKDIANRNMTQLWSKESQWLIEEDYNTVMEKLGVDWREDENKTFKEIYNLNYFENCDGFKEWQNNMLKFGDAYASILYAHDIDYGSIFKEFPRVTFPQGKEGSEHYTLKQQLEFLQKNKKRTPKNILEIGGGRGEITNTLAYLGYNVTSVEFHPNAEKLFKETGIKFFNKEQSYNLINENIKDVELDLSKFDTIIMCESIEHIPEKHFNNFYQNLIKNFKGYFILTNWIHPFPIFVSGTEHCRRIDNELYDNFSKNAKRTVFRRKSHLCLEFDNKE
jgi:2-polyprenyl-3-methyl-5-hydroxy-6-metoxy-1,4-benzoquinol methylase